MIRNKMSVNAGLILLLILFGAGINVLHAQVQTWTQASADSFRTGFGIDTLSVSVVDTIGSQGGIQLALASDQNFALNKEVVDSDNINQAATQAPKNVTDGNLTTFWASVNVNPVGVSLTVDLASTRLVARVKISAFATDFRLKGYKIYLSQDGETFNEVVSQTDNAAIVIDETFDAQETRFVRVEITETVANKQVLITELEVYGVGFSSDGQYYSQVKQFPSKINFGQISWESELPDNTYLSMQCRSDSGASTKEFEVVSNDTIIVSSAAIIRGTLNITEQPGNQPLVEGTDYYINYETGEFVRISGGAIDLNDIVRATFKYWSHWSPAFNQSPADLAIPEPRDYFQYRVILKSDNSRLTPRVYSVSMTYLDRLVASASRITVSPDTVDILRDQQVTCAFHLEFTDTDFGVDMVEIGVPAQTKNLQVFIDGSETTAFSDLSSTNMVAVQLGQTLKNVGNVLLEVKFSITLYEDFHLFPATIYSLESPVTEAFGQIVDHSLTSYRVTTQGVPSSTLANVVVKPNPFSPNGDGIFDELSVELFVTKLTVARNLTIKVFDLQGTLVKTLADENLVASPVGVTWDGYRKDGSKTRPGIYLLQIRLITDDEDTVVNKLITVVY